MPKMGVSDFIIELFETGPRATIPLLRHGAGPDDVKKFDRERSILSQVFSIWSLAMLFQGFTSVIAFLSLNTSKPYPDVLVDSGSVISSGLPGSVPDILEGIVFFGFFIRFLGHSGGLRVIRRFFILHGSILLMRALTITLTPYANIMPGCNDLPTISLVTPGSLLHLFLLFPGHTCGDYVFSGHTVLFVLCAILWRHEFGSSDWSSRFITMCSVLGTLSLPLFRYHYSIDCVLAVILTVLSAGIFMHVMNPHDVLFDFPAFVYAIDDEIDDAIVLASAHPSSRDDTCAIM